MPAGASAMTSARLAHSSELRKPALPMRLAISDPGPRRCAGNDPRNYAIRNEKTSGGRVIKTLQQQNDIGVVRAPKGEQNSSVEKGRPTTVQSLNFKKLKS